MDDLSYISEPTQIAGIAEMSKGLNFGMPSEALLGCLLKTLVASKPEGRFLELGTGTGIATAWLLSGMDAASSLVSVDTDLNFQAVAKAVLGSDKRVTFRLEDGLTFLLSQKAHTFDMVFADAMPGKYEGLNDALKVVKVGGFYVIDDMLPQQNWPEGHAARIPVLLERLSKHPDFTLLPLVWSSGVAIAVRQR